MQRHTKDQDNCIRRRIARPPSSCRRTQPEYTEAEESSAQHASQAVAFIASRYHPRNRRYKLQCRYSYATPACESSSGIYSSGSALQALQQALRAEILRWQ